MHTAEKMLTVFPPVTLKAVKDNRFILSAIFFLSLLYFIQGLSVHGIEYRDDEIFYFRSAQEMSAEGNFLSPTYFGENRFQKPILFYWLVILSYKIFGINWFATRFVSAAFAALTVSLTWLIGKEFFDKKIAAVGSLIVATLPLFFRHAKNAVPDMALNFFIVLGFYAAWRFIRNPSETVFRHLFFISCALGFLTKGFAAFVVSFASVILYVAATGNKKALESFRFLNGTFLFLAIVLPWFLFMIGRHGNDYLGYVLKTETMDRLIEPEARNVFLAVAATFIRNLFFYISTVFSYYAPWCLFGLAALPFAGYLIARKDAAGERLLFLFIWFFAGFLFFSSIATRINHLILVLTTPFALLLAYFFLKIGESDFRWKNSVAFLLKATVVVFLFLGFVGLSFIRVFLMSESQIWFAAFLILFAAAAFAVIKAKEPVVVPAVLGFLILFALLHASLLSRGGVTTLSCLQRFAAVVQAGLTPDDNIVVASHDIHEKEFQIFFDRQVRQIGASVPEAARANLENFFAQNKGAYCLILGKDYENLMDVNLKKNFRALKEDYIFKRRIYPDGGLWRALFTVNRGAVKNYFMEKIILLKRIPYA